MMTIALAGTSGVDPFNTILPTEHHQTVTLDIQPCKVTGPMCACGFTGDNA